MGDDVQYCGYVFQTITSMLKKPKLGKIRGDAREDMELELSLKGCIVRFC